MNTQVATQQKPVNVLTTMLNAPTVQEQFKNALKENKDLFVSSLIDLYTGDKSLQSCKPAAIISEALRAATLKLPLNKALGFAYIVVYNNSVKDEHGNWVKVPTPTFIPGYKGYIQLAMRTGQYKTINADVVYEGEMQKVNKLTGEVTFDGEKVSDKVVGYFCYFQLLNGFSKTLYMSVEDMAVYAKRYSKGIAKNVTAEDLMARAGQSVANAKVGWDNFDAMAVKTVTRRLLSKYGYLSVEMQGAIAKDIEHDNAQEQRTDILATTEANVETVNTEDAAYEEVDTATGEVYTAAPSAPYSEPTATAAAEPEY